MRDEHEKRRRTWAAKFRDAFRGVWLGIQGQSSFFVHIFAATAVIVAAAVLRVDRMDWCILLLCIFGVLTAEMLNSAIESLARAVTDKPNTHVGRALDISSGAVLIASIGSVIIGLVVFLHRLAELFL